MLGKKSWMEKCCLKKMLGDKILNKIFQYKKCWMNKFYKKKFA